MLHDKIKGFKTLLVDTFSENCDSGLYTLQHHLLDHIMADIRRSRTMLVLDSSSNEHFNKHIKLAYRRTSQRR